MSFCSLIKALTPKTGMLCSVLINSVLFNLLSVIVQELCESRGGRPGLSVLTSLPVSVDVKNY